MTEKRYLTWKDCVERAVLLASQIDQRLTTPGEIAIYGVPRGGIPVVALLHGALDRVGRPSRIVTRPEVADMIVDDLIDTGATRDRYEAQHPKKYFAALYDKSAMPDCPWLVFPWEIDEGGTDASAQDIAIRIMEYIGEDPSRQGLIETPSRFQRALDAWFSGYGDRDFDPKCFTDGAEGYNEMIVETGIPVWSHCEHHIAPFFGVAHIGYIPRDRIIGLSKLPRLVDHYARRLQVQERLTVQIAEALEEALGIPSVPHGMGPPVNHGVAVVLQCRHTCMESRGIRQSGIQTTTSALRGAFRGQGKARAEFFAMVPRP